ncbi:hypothetical protein ABE26_16030 [Cytobacillus firmus]|nr:hypothetical protein [Cytobacillus firmus]
MFLIDCRPGATLDSGKGNRPLDSEPRSTSDTEKGKRTRRVRTRVNFGHRKGKMCPQSPNPGQLWTQEREIVPLESEPRSTSDTEKGKRTRRVRTRVNFGHRKGKMCPQSPNPGQLRTLKRENAPLESEPGSTSDTKKENALIESEPAAAKTRRSKNLLPSPNPR